MSADLANRPAPRVINRQELILDGIEQHAVHDFFVCEGFTLHKYAPVFWRCLWAMSVSVSSGALSNDDVSSRWMLNGGKTTDFAELEMICSSESWPLRSRLLYYLMCVDSCSSILVLWANCESPTPSEETPFFTYITLFIETASTGPWSSKNGGKWSCSRYWFYRHKGLFGILGRCRNLGRLQWLRRRSRHSVVLKDLLCLQSQL